MGFWKNKQVLVTGGAGFIGSHLVELLVRQGSKVTVVDNLESGKKKNLSAVIGRIKLITDDLRDRTVCRKATKNKDIVFDLAARAYGVGYSGQHHAEMLTSNVLISANVLESACANSVGRFLVVSSSCVYSDSAPTPTPELDVNVGYPEKANEGYGWAKRFAEIQAGYCAREFPRTKISIVRPTNAYGGNRCHWETDKAHVIPSLIKKIFSGHNPLVVWGSGNQTRNFMHVVDLARAFMMLVEKHPLTDPVNIGTENEISIKNLVYKLLKITGREDVKVVFDRRKPEGRKNKSVDISKLKKIGFKPLIGLDQGLSEMVESHCRLFHKKSPTRKNP